MEVEIKEMVMVMRRGVRNGSGDKGNGDGDK